jgi:hypothetical protein
VGCAGKRGKTNMRWRRNQGMRPFSLICQCVLVLASSARTKPGSGQEVSEQASKSQTEQVEINWGALLRN